MSVTIMPTTLAGYQMIIKNAALDLAARDRPMTIQRLLAITKLEQAAEWLREADKVEK